MIKIANKLTNLLTNNNNLSLEEKEWYSYIIEKALVKYISHVLIFLIGSIVSNPINSICLSWAISRMRRFSDGWHAQSFLICLMLSCTVAAFSLSYGMVALKSNIFMKYIILFFSASLIFISKDELLERKKNFKRQLIFFIILIIINNIVGLNTLSNILSLSVIFTACTILPKLLKKEIKNEKYN